LKHKKIINSVVSKREGQIQPNYIRLPKVYSIDVGVV